MQGYGPSLTAEPDGSRPCRPMCTLGQTEGWAWVAQKDDYNRTTHYAFNVTGGHADNCTCLAGTCSTERSEVIVY
jgi:hypothetical protein